MTTAQQEILIDRYLCGEMSAAEEQEFLMQVATNSNLFQALRANRMVEQALARDREALPSGYVAVQERAMGALAAGAVSLESIARNASTAPRWLSGRWIATFAVAATAIASAIVGYLSYPALQTSDVSNATGVQQNSTASPMSTPNQTAQSRQDNLDVNQMPASVPGERTSRESTLHGESARGAERSVAPPRREQALRSATVAKSERNVSSVETNDGLPSQQKASTTESSVEQQDMRSRIAPPRDSITFRARIVLPDKPSGQKP